MMAATQLRLGDAELVSDLREALELMHAARSKLARHTQSRPPVSYCSRSLEMDAGVLSNVIRRIGACGG